VKRGLQRVKLKKSPLLETVAMERLLKIQQTGKGLAGAVVICELSRLAVALYLLAFPSRVLKWSLNPFTNPNPVYSHIYYVTISFLVLTVMTWRI
jgi:hypothetical protein